MDHVFSNAFSSKDLQQRVKNFLCCCTNDLSFKRLPIPPSHTVGLFPAVSHSLNALLVHYVAKSNIRTRVRLGRSLAASASLPMPFDTSHALCG